MKTFITSILGASLGVLAAVAAAQEGNTEHVSQLLKERFPGLEVHEVAPSPIAGVLQVSVPGGVIYASADAEYILNGKLIETATGRDISEEVIAEGRLADLGGVSEEDMIIFEPSGEVKHTITTFTDVDCPYCRKMHSEISMLNDLGIRVRYLAYPRTGVDSPSYDTAVAVWCAEDRQAAMTTAKSGEKPEASVCENPVQEHMALAQRFGIEGTPMTITDTGERIMGYVPASQLRARLDGKREVAIR